MTTLDALFDEQSCDVSQEALNQYVSNLKAYEHLRQKGFIAKTMENYRHVKLDGVLSMPVLDGVGQSDYHEYASDDFYLLVFAGGLVHEASTNLPEMVHLTQTKNSSDFAPVGLSPVNLLNQALSPVVYKLHIATTLDKPILIVNVVDAEVDGAYFCDLQIAIEKDCKAQVIDHMASQCEASTYTNLRRSFAIDRQAHLSYVKNNCLGLTHTLSVSYFVSIAGGCFEAQGIEKGSKYTLNEWEVYLDEPQSVLDMASIVCIDGESAVSNTIEVSHNAPHTSSHQVFRHLLDGSSQGIFNSKIIVGKHCPSVKAHQQSQTILLSESARMFNEPRMMIFTDDLEASHGATVGSLDEQAINYLRLRGLSFKQAVRILQEAFEADIVNRITNSSVRDYVIANQGAFH